MSLTLYHPVSATFVARLLHGEGEAQVFRRRMQRRIERADEPLRLYLERRGETLRFVIAAGELTAGDQFCRLGVGDSMVAAYYPDQGLAGAIAFEDVGQIGYTGAGNGRMLIGFYPADHHSLNSQPLKLYWTQANGLALEWLKALGRSCREAGFADCCFLVVSDPGPSGGDPGTENWIERVERGQP